MSDISDQILCAECGETVEAGSGRYNVGSRRYHVDCYDPGRHLELPSVATLSEGSDLNLPPLTPVRSA